MYRPDKPQTAVARLTGRLAQCAGCGAVFSSTSAFDQHRHGRARTRVCQDPAASGLVIGERNTGTFWKHPPSARLRTHLQHVA